MKNLVCILIVFMFSFCHKPKKNTPIGSEENYKKSITENSEQIYSGTCSGKVLDFFKLKDKKLQSSFFTQLDSIKKAQYPDDNQETSIMVDITPDYLNQFLADINATSFEIHNTFEKDYHFNIAPQGFTDPEICKDKIKVSFDAEYCTFHLNIYNTFLVEDDWCTESVVMYGFKITNRKITNFWRQEAG